MKILTISGSARFDSANTKLLAAFPSFYPSYSFHHFFEIAALPLFKAEADKHPWPKEVINWRKTIQEADALIISTPEYIHNIPALLKNALEWSTSSGELANKRVLAITFTPHPPRGEKAMQSLLWSLQALNATIVAQLPLYQNEIVFDKKGLLVESEMTEILKEAISLLSA